MSEIRVQPARIEQALGVEGLLEAPVQGHEGGGQRVEDLTVAVAAAEQARVTADPLRRRADGLVVRVAAQPALGAAPLDELPSRKRQGLCRRRLRFRKMKGRDWLWSIAAVLLTGILSTLVMTALETITGAVAHQPPFMQFEPLSSGRYWILGVWLPYWLLNIMGEEILWRGVIFPRQEIVFGKYTWLFHGFCWSLFHLPFGWQLFLTMLPILFIQSLAVQKTKNTWVGVLIHAVINGPSFIAISFGLL